MLNNRKPSKPGQHETSPALKRVRKSVYTQALLTVFLIVLTVVVLFAVTAAWYTNIVQTNDLVFKASKWGFEGEVKSVDATIIASPGDEGVVELTARSESDGVTAVSVNISKAHMPEEIQKRIYFYADTAKNVSSETVDRVYLGNNNSYTYTLIGPTTLMLTETVHNDVLIKWHWVYDVLGYYVLGTWDGSDMTVSEYLRPIEYDYDEALTEFDANGNLVSVDGSTSVARFLTRISAGDGYAGTIDVTEKNSGGYYPVSVDNSGYGVWAYLCTYSEIQVNTAYDTYLGENANRFDAEGEQASYVAKLTLSAQNSHMEPTQISTASALISALNTGEAAMLRLSGDIALDEPLVIGAATESQQIMLDLNGNTLTVDSGAYADNGAAIQVAAGSTLIMSNGTLEGSGEEYAIDGAGASITLSGVDITGMKRALNVRDYVSTNIYNSDATIRVVDCEIETTDVAILISGNGQDSAQATRLVVEDSVIRSDYIGIAFNGSSDQWGTSTQIIGSDVYGYWAGIYHPQGDAELTISDGSVISGYTGMVLKGGSTTVTDSTIHGTGALQIPERVSMSGFNDTGDGIYIETNYGCPIQLQVSGTGAVISDQAQALRIYPESDMVSWVIEDSVTVMGAVDMQ